MNVRNLWRVVAVGATAAVLAAGFAGCASKPGAGSGDDKTLTVVSWKGEGTDLGGMPEINAAFEKAYPDIKLDYKFVSRDTYETYNNPRLAGGNGADVMMLDRVLMLEWSKQGFLGDLSDQAWVKRMDPSLKPFNSVKGKTYQFNAESVPIGLFVNPTLLKSAGIENPPTTWTEFVDDLKLLKSKNLGGLILPNKGAWIGEQLALLLAAQHVDANWPQQYDAGKATFGPSWAPVVDQIKQLFSEGVVDPKLSLGLDPNVDGIPQFEAGKWAFMIQGSWALNSVKSASAFPVVMQGFPGGDTPKAFDFVGSGWGINAKAKHRGAAEKYLEFLTRPATAAIFLKAESAFSTLTDVESPVTPENTPIAQSQKQGDNVPSFAEALNAPDAESGIQKGIENVFINPSAPSADTTKLLDSLVKPTPLP